MSGSTHSCGEERRRGDGKSQCEFFDRLFFAGDAQPSQRRQRPDPAPHPHNGSLSGEPAVADLEIVEAWCKGEGCAICVRACPERCLGFDEDGLAVRVTRPGACTGCRLCELFCPDFAIVVKERALT